VGTVLAIVASPLFSPTTIFGDQQAHLLRRAAITAVFLLAWKRASGKSAFITLVAGMGLGAVMFVVDWCFYQGDFMLIAFLLLVACLGIMIVTTCLFPAAQGGPALVGRTGASHCAASARAGPGQYRLASLAVGTFVVLYVVFR
jgi:hypothetical protein